MTVESATYINDLDNTYPAGTDYKSEGDDHIRLIKAAVKNTFPNVTGAVTPTHTELNYVDGVTSAIQTQLNDLAALVAGEGVLPSGTTMLFAQTAAPTGWTKSTTHNNKALRVVSGTASSGGSVAFSTVFGLTATDAFTLTSSHIPSHTHGVSITSGTESADHTHTVSGTTGTEGAHTHNVTNGVTTVVGTGNLTGGSETNISFEAVTTGAGSAHSHSFSATSSGKSATHTHSISGDTGATGSGGSHTHAIDLRVQYVDVIIASLD